MQRISNNPDDIVDEMLKGFLKVHSDIVEKTENSRVMKAKNISKEKVGVIAGEVLMWKVGGIKVSLGANLDEVIAVAQKPIGHTRSVGIGLSPCTLSAVEHPNFEIKNVRLFPNNPLLTHHLTKNHSCQCTNHSRHNRSPHNYRWVHTAILASISNHINRN